MGQIDLPRRGFGQISGGTELYEAEWLTDADLFEPAAAPPTNNHVLDAAPAAFAIAAPVAAVDTSRLLVASAGAVIRV